MGCRPPGAHDEHNDRTHRPEAEGDSGIDQDRPEEERVVAPAERFNRGNGHKGGHAHPAAEALPGRDADHLDEGREHHELACGHQRPCDNQHLRKTL